MFYEANSRPSFLSLHVSLEQHSYLPYIRNGLPPIAQPWCLVVHPHSKLVETVYCEA